MTIDLRAHLSKILNETITKVSSVHGGDISTAFKIDTQINSFFLKLYTNKNAAEMFQAEAYGLELIGKTNTIKTPKVLACDIYKDSAFLLMEFIESKSPSPVDFKNLGLKLAELHAYTSEYFGLNQDNFIGSLPQSNATNTSWVDFYTLQRLVPQLQLANQKQLLSKTECPTKNQISNTLKPLFTDIKPSLLHGDLWSGNYLISKNGIPYLIDPSIYFGHSEVDIAMTKLFSGFGEDFYNAYHSKFPQDSNTASIIEIYQLYYLLVHLNLFGSSYYASVVSILRKYF